MKKLFFLGILLLSLTSCGSNYLYCTLKTQDSNIKQNSDGSFVLDNDSVEIVYSFNGKDAPLQISVYNKSNQPLRIDWSKSALLIKDKSISYLSNTAYFQGNTNGYASVSGNVNGQVSGKIHLPSSMDFILPKSKVSKNVVRIETNVNDFTNIKYSKVLMADKDGQTVNVSRAYFNNQDTPIKFTSYLTLYTESDKPIVYEQDFFVSSLLKTKSISPNNLPGDMGERGDFFYTKK